MREIKFRGKTAIDFENGRGDVIKKKSEWIYGGISMEVNRVWIDMPYYGQILVDKETVRSIHRTKRQKRKRNI